MKQNRDAVSLSLLLMIAVVLVGGIVVLWQLPEDDGDFQLFFGEEVLHVYGLRDGSGTQASPPVEAYLVSPSDADVRSAVRAVTGALSEEVFRGLPIHVLGVETIDGSLRAFVDLAEPEDAAGATWMQTFFQGSALGRQTQTALVQTLLQPGYRGEWIDSVTFYYQGRPFRTLDHIDLAPVFRRESPLPRSMP